MKSTRVEYLAFFRNWLFYQFDRQSDVLRNLIIVAEVKKIVFDDDEAAYWGGCDCWTMHKIATDNLAERAIVAVE
jgi:hypothetical protein